LQHACILPNDFMSFSVILTRRCYPAATRRWRYVVVIEQDAVCCTVQVVKLTGLQGPQESQQAQESQPHRQRNEKDQRVHRFGPIGAGAVTGAEH